MNPPGAAGCMVLPFAGMGVDLEGRKVIRRVGR